MQYSAKYLPKSVLQIDVELETKEITEIYDKAVNKAVAEAKITGFRKGKAPRSMVEPLLDREQVLNSGISKEIDKILRKALHEESNKNPDKRYIVLDTPRITTDGEQKEGNPLKFTITCSLYPDVDIVKLKELKVDMPAISEPTETEVQEKIDQLYATYLNIKKREMSKDGTEEVSDEQLKQKYPKDAEFYKALGLSTEEEIQKNIHEELEWNNRYKAEMEYETKVIEEAVKSITIDIPDHLVNSEVNAIQNRYQSSVSRVGSTLEKALEAEGTTLDKKREEWIKQATNNVAISLILTQIQNEEKIEVTDEEVQVYNQNYPHNNSLPASTIKYIIGQNKALQVLKDRVKKS